MLVCLHDASQELDCALLWLLLLLHAARLTSLRCWAAWKSALKAWMACCRMTSFVTCGQQ